MERKGLIGIETKSKRAFFPIVCEWLPIVLILAATIFYPASIWIIFPFLTRSIYGGIMKVFLSRRNLFKDVSEEEKKEKKHYAVMLNGGILILIFFSAMPLLLANIWILLLMSFIVFKWLKEIRLHICPVRGREKKKRHWKLLAGIGIVLYLFLGATIPYIRQPEISDDFRNSFDTTDFFGEEKCSDRVAIIEDNGEALAERIRMISHARESIVLSTFDFHSDHSGQQMIAALKAAAGRGVHVRILVDGFNSWVRMTGNAYFYSLASDLNVTIKLYNQVNPILPWRAMSRMHDKYLIVDESLYLLGGRNIYDYFLGDQKGHKNYDRDVLVYSTGDEESSLNQIRDYFENIWNSSLCKSWNNVSWLSWIPSVRIAKKELSEQYRDMKKRHADWFESKNYYDGTMAANRITLLSNPTGLYSKDPQVFYGLCELMKQADHEVIWHTPYLICNNWMYKSLGELSDQIPSVTVMTNSAANNGNPFGAVDYDLHKDEILQTGITVKEYEGGVSYHGKSAVVDDRLAIVGSFNIDMKSAYQDTELMLVIDSRQVSAQLKQNLLSYQEQAVTASDQEEENAENTLGFAKKLQHFFIGALNPYLRFLF